MKSDKSEIFQIEEGQGLEVLKFGFSRDEIEVILGIPSEIKQYSYSDDKANLTETWYYNDLGLSLNFDEEDNWRLGTIAVESKLYRFKDFIPIGLSKDELRYKLGVVNINDLQYENWNSKEKPTHELLFSGSLGINFWFDEDCVSQIQWGPDFIDDNTINWPS
ncbi:hypothetical protein [Sediminitomix flava]|uniref:Uncharacterized protein n=1 Tax=Sediminitomix flava TaxID=379075 RepID=A0A315Z684_SEDFL|nr:hypothetical protein [Sediminitomix flava]PWJ37871.1 hypothetical protein BC781_1086 [Sediminitomix flava]